MCRGAFRFSVDARFRPSGSAELYGDAAFLLATRGNRMHPSSFSATWPSLAVLVVSRLVAVSVLFDSPWPHRPPWKREGRVCEGANLANARRVSASAMTAARQVIPVFARRTLSPHYTIFFCISRVHSELSELKYMRFIDVQSSVAARCFLERYSLHSTLLKHDVEADSASGTLERLVVALSKLFCFHFTVLSFFTCSFFISRSRSLVIKSFVPHRFGHNIFRDLHYYFDGIRQ